MPEPQLPELLKERPFVCAPLEMDFVGGPNDGRSESLPSWMLEVRVAGHKYHMAVGRSDDPTVPYKYVLVSHTLMELP